MVYRQERAHFLPTALAGTTATPRTSGMTKASAGAGARNTAIALVMQISARSTPSSAAASSSSLRCTIGDASRLDPMRLAARSISSAPVTTDRTRRILSHFSASVSSFQAAGSRGNSSRCTERFSPPSSTVSP